MEISEKIKNITASKSVSFAQKVVELKHKGEEIIELNIGAPDSDTDSSIISATIDALKSGYTRYSMVSGEKKLREVIAKRLKRENKKSAH